MQTLSHQTQLPIEVIVNIGYIGSSHALIESTVYLIANGSKTNVIRRNEYLVPSSEVEQVVQRSFNYPMQEATTDEQLARHFRYVYMDEFAISDHPLTHASIENGLAVDREGTPLTPDRVIPFGFREFEISLAGSIPLPQKLMYGPDSYVQHDSLKLDSTWLRLDPAVEALNALPGVTAEIKNSSKLVRFGVKRDLYITIELEPHRKTIESAIQAYLAYATNPSHDGDIEYKNLYMIVFESVLRDALTPSFKYATQ